MPRGRSMIRRRRGRRRYSTRTTRGSLSRGSVSRVMQGTNGMQAFNLNLSKKIVNMGYGLPNAVLVNLRYSDLITIASTGGIPSRHTFRTSLFDPDFTGAGHQPMYRDQYAAIYEKYVVYGIEYTLQFINMSDTVPARVCTLHNDADTAWGTFLAVENAGASQTAILGTLDGGNNVKTIKGRIMVKDVLGIPKSKVNEDDVYSSDVGTNPAIQAFLQLLVDSMDGSSTTDVHVQVNLQYLCKFYNKEETASS